MKKFSLIFIMIGFALILAPIVKPAQQISASGPRFNYMEGDYETFRGANSSAGETNWRDPVTGKPGDAIAFNVYFHNGVENTIATNTRIKVDLPQPTKSPLVAKATLSADNAPKVTDTMTVNVTGTSEKVFFEYTPGSTLLYPSQNKVPKPDPVKLPDTITTTGVNIGDIQGCWPFAGFVVFQARIHVKGAPALEIQKSVANSTAGEKDWKKQTNANPGDVVAYRIFFKNPGTQDTTNVIITDLLAPHTTYIIGTTKIFTNATGTGGSPLPDTITTGGVNIGTLKPSGENSGWITFQAKVDTSLAPSNYTLVNTAKIKSDQVGPLQDTATVLVSVVKPENADLSIQKRVKNVTKGDKDFLDLTTAIPKDILIFRIDFSNPGKATAKDVRISDQLPAFMDYRASTTILVIDKNAPQSIQDGIITDTGISIGDLGPGVSGFVTFEVKIIDNPPVGQHRLINTAKIWASNVPAKTATAVVCLTVVQPPQPPVLDIDKLVANLTKGETQFVKSNSAFPGDVLQYRIFFKNTGKSTATGVRVVDQLPTDVEFISGSGMLFIGTLVQPLSDAVVSPNGVNIPNLVAGQDGYIALKVKVKNTVVSGQVLVNVAHIFADQNLHALSQAETKVKIPEKPQPKPQPQPSPISAKPLPPTGAGIGIVLVLTGLTMAIYSYLKQRKLLAQTLRYSRIIK